MNYAAGPQASQYGFDADYISIRGHDLQDILMRINMPRAASRFRNLWVKVNPFVDCNSPQFLAEVWGVSNTANQETLQCLYIAPK